MKTIKGRVVLGTKLLSAAVVLGAGIGQACASYAEGEYHGYFRAGAGSNSAKGSQACFGLAGVAKYRFGNECDTYGEFGYTKEFAKSSNGASYVGTVMANFYEPNSGSNSKNWGLAQMMVEAKKLDFLGGGTAWVGKRYYNRPDMHVLDMKMVHMDGVGAGIDGIKAGPGRFSYALMRNDDQGAVGTSSATRHQLLYHGLPVNTNGTINLDATIISADSKVANSKGGYSLSLTHKQDKLLGGDNTLWLQYGQGAGAQTPGQVGDILAGSDTTQTRVGDQLIWQFTPEFTGSLNFVYQRNKTPGGTTTWTSFGARPTYALTENIKLVLDVGHDRVSPATGNTQQLTKVTFAPVLAAGKGFWSRPELRAFVTYAKWNDAAQATGIANGVFGSATNGTSVGIQAEVWF